MLNCTMMLKMERDGNAFTGGALLWPLSLGRRRISWSPEEEEAGTALPPPRLCESSSKILSGPLSHLSILPLPSNSAVPFKPAILCNTWSFSISDSHFFESIRDTVIKSFMFRFLLGHGYLYTHTYMSKARLSSVHACGGHLWSIQMDQTYDPPKLHMSSNFRSDPYLLNYWIDYVSTQIDC